MTIRQTFAMSLHTFALHCLERACAFAEWTGDYLAAERRRVMRREYRATHHWVDTLGRVPGRPS